jgi:hypothetical protein
MISYSLPKLGEAKDMQQVRDWADQFAGAVEEALQQIASQAGIGYQVTNNPTQSRSLDVGAATLGDTRAVLGTLIEDLLAKRPSVLGGA